MVCERCGMAFLPGEAYVHERYYASGSRARGVLPDRPRKVAALHVGPCPTGRRFRAARLAAGMLPEQRNLRTVWAA